MPGKAFILFFIDAIFFIISASFVTFMCFFFKLNDEVFGAMIKSKRSSYIADYNFLFLSFGVPQRELPDR